MYNRFKRHLAFGASLALLATPSGASTAQTNGTLPDTGPDTGSDWYRQAAISPNGQTIAFTYKGNLYRVEAAGGNATPLTVHKAWEGHPVWSKDGSKIAFASDRYGNLDVFVMDAAGGEAERLTHHSADDVPTDFHPNGSHVLFTSARQDDEAAALGFVRAGELYAAPMDGSTPSQVLTTPASEARYNADGSQIIYRGETGYENEFRKRDLSPFARDVWLYDAKSGKHTNITNVKSGNHTPLFNPNGDGYIYLSDRQGSFNILRQGTNSGPKSVTRLNTHPVRSLSAANDGTLAFTWHGGLFTINADGSNLKQLDVNIAADNSANIDVMDVSSSAREFAVSPDGKEIAFIARGDVFITSVEFATTVQITNTPAEEKDLAFAPDGKKLYFASERGGNWGIYTAARGREDDLYFFTSTDIVVEKLALDAKQAIQPVPSPDGKKLAFMAERLTLKVQDLENNKLYTLSDPIETYGVSDGGTTISWSPDSLKLAYDINSNGRLFFTNIAIQPWNGSEKARDFSLSGYTDAAPVWHPSGDAIYWYSARYGQRDHGSHGTEFDILAGFVNQHAWTKFKRSKEEIALQKELEKKAKEAEKKAKADDEKTSEKSEKTGEDAVDPVVIEWDVLEDLQEKLTVHSSDISAAVLSKDMDKLFYLSAFEGGFDLWVQDFKEGSTKKLLPLGARGGSLELSDDGKTLFLLSGGRIRAINVGNGKPKPVPVKAEMRLDRAAERAYILNHAWSQVNDRFYRGDDKHGVDWDLMGKAYAAKVGSIGHSRDMAVLLSELLGELNASHTGGRYRAPRGGDATPSIGALYELNKEGGLLITHLFKKGPLVRSGKQVAVGDIVTAIDGVDLSGTNAYALLNNKAGHRTRLTIQSGEEVQDIVIKPASLGEESSWRYERWVASRAAAVDKLSGGKLGYVHLPFMGDSVYRRVYRDIFGKYFDREGLVVDSRWNRGGDLMEDLIKLLTSGDMQYTRNAPYGKPVQGEPLNRWVKPTIVLANEANYSDGHCFPTAYKNVKAGTLVGTPITGTCSYVWWERTIDPELIFGVPTLGIFDPAGDWLELKDTQPDIEVYNSPEDRATGRDPQLEAAVKQLLKELR